MIREADGAHMSLGQASVTNMNPPMGYSLWHERVMAAIQGSTDPEGAASAIIGVAQQLLTKALTAQVRAALLFECSSWIINYGADLRDVQLVAQGRDFAELALNETSADEPLHFQCLYNVANATAITCDFGLPKTGRKEEWEPALIANRLTHKVELRQARRQFFDVASSEIADSHSRSAAYCNLANSLDYSGRWAEAYDFYLSALEQDPANGNAAGNLAQLLSRRIASGVGQTGHIAAVYDKYVRLAQSLRDGTVSFAGQGAAGLWDALQLTDSHGHLSHGVDDQDDDYRKWVAAFRLALSPAVEGLGSEGPHWDSATIEVLYGTSLETLSPPILAEMNVLKSDFLVSRRLGYEGYVSAAEGPEQEADDSGFYVETLDYSLYGTQYSKLFLAQRSALDVLDKTAVVVNEHFKIGDRADRVSFRKFWTEKDGSVRNGLVSRPGRALPSFALAELAWDMDDQGMYASSQDFRNAGTHRIVHAAYLDPTGVTSDARSRIELFNLVNSTVLALQVTRSAYLYLVDLVASWNHPDDHEGNYAAFPSFEYMHFPDSSADDRENDSSSG
jgi:tetratricopeptide (TPR) repeat protein